MVEDSEVRRPPAFADRLDHLDADDCVVVAADVAVVLDADVHAIREPGLPNAIARQCRLLRRQRERRDVRAASRGSQRKLAPAGPDFEHPASWPNAGDVEKAFDLPALCSVQRFGEIVEER